MQINFSTMWTQKQLDYFKISKIKFLLSMTTPRERSVFSQIFSFQHVYSFEYPLRYFWKRLIVFPWIVRKNQKLSHGKRPTNIFMIPRFRKLATPLPFFFKKMKIKLCPAGDSLNNSYSSSSVFSRVSPRCKLQRKGDCFCV